MSKQPKYTFAIAGAGFSGAVLARELVTKCDCRVIIFDERSHIGGNCYSEKDKETGIEIHKYGPHIFNTNNEGIWKYVNRFCTMGTYIHQVQANTTKGMYNLPVNLNTINSFFQKSYNPEAATNFLNSLVDHSIETTTNFEEHALKYLGKDLYYTFIHGYTKKQWGCEPKELPAAIIKRLPIRFNYNNNYHNSKFVGIPSEGYTELVRNILTHDNIEVKLNSIIERNAVHEFDHMFYCGALDKFYDYKFGRLGYRTVYWETHKSKGDYQGAAQINYTEMNVPYTRIIEHKHFNPWKEFKETIYSIEYSKETENDETPFYPKRLEADKNILALYRKHALETENNISFIGRLGTYRYLDMDKIILEAIEFANTFIQNTKNRGSKPIFPNKEI